MSEEAPVEPDLHAPTDQHVGLLVWRWPQQMNLLSSAPVRGGFQTAHWLLNIGVPLTYDRTDLSVHSQEVASSLGLDGDGVALFTAAKVAEWRRHSVGEAAVDVTVGVSKPTWAADPNGGWNSWRPGTVNLVIQLPMALDAGAAVNAVATVTEAKTQAFFETGMPGTGTASDAVVLAWPSDSTEAMAQFAGPRSEVGSQIAQAVHGAVTSGITAWQHKVRKQIAAEEAGA